MRTATKDDKFHKRSPKSKIWWVDSDEIGPMLFSFGKKTIHNVFGGTKQELTKEEWEIFKKEEPTLSELMF